MPERLPHLPLLEADAAAEEAFGRGSPGVDALSVVLAAITQATRSKSNRPAVVQRHVAARNDYAQPREDPP